MSFPQEEQQRIKIVPIEKKDFCSQAPTVTVKMPEGDFKTVFYAGNISLKELTEVVLYKNPFPSTIEKGVDTTWTAYHSVDAIQDMLEANQKFRESLGFLG